MAASKDQDQSKLEALKLSLKEIEQRLTIEDEQPAPAAIKHLEKRMQALQQELNGLNSEKMLAYKLQRLAQSKLLSDVQDQLSLSATKVEQAKQKKKEVEKKPSTERDKQYLSSTFKCKSDLDLCLLDSKSALGKALCYTLFIRCMLKG